MPLLLQVTRRLVEVIIAVENGGGVISQSEIVVINRGGSVIEVLGGGLRIIVYRNIVIVECNSKIGVVSAVQKVVVVICEIGIVIMKIAAMSLMIMKKTDPIHQHLLLHIYKLHQHATVMASRMIVDARTIISVASSKKAMTT